MRSWKPGWKLKELQDGAAVRVMWFTEGDEDAKYANAVVRGGLPYSRVTGQCFAEEAHGGICAFTVDVEPGGEECVPGQDPSRFEAVRLQPEGWVVLTPWISTLDGHLYRAHAWRSYSLAVGWNEAQREAEHIAAQLNAVMES